MKTNEPRILLVDDVNINLTAGVSFFELFGISAETATGGREAAEKARSTHYDIIFMDLYMPDIDGFEACKIIRSGGNTGVKIIALSADDDYNYAIKYLKLLRYGFDDFMPKPLTKTAIRDMLTKHLPPDKRDSLSQDDTELNFDNPEIMQHQLRRMLEKSLTVLKPPATNYKALKAELHALKGALAVVGEAELTKIAQTLETTLKIGDIDNFAAKLPAFIHALTELHKTLPAPPETNAKPRKPADQALLHEIAQDLITTIEQFNRQAALDTLSRAAEYTFDNCNAAADTVLAQVKTDLEEYDYESAIEKLMKLLED